MNERMSERSNEQALRACALVANAGSNPAPLTMISLCKRCDKRFINTTDNYYRPKICPECRKEKGGKNNFLGKRGYMERLVNNEIKIKRLETEYGKGGITWKKNICIELVSE